MRHSALWRGALAACSIGKGQTLPAADDERTTDADAVRHPFGGSQLGRIGPTS